jgi:DNA ligase-associated metallophosphoesterase
MHQEIDIKGASLWLLSEKAIFWPEESLLIISDLHLGKASHFRKHGIPIPAKVHNKDLEVLETLIHRYNPSTVLFLGDLFHSSYNQGWRPFAGWLTLQENRSFILVKGNHDILPKTIYQNSELELTHLFRKGPFSFTHEKIIEKASYNISGHVHPCVRLNGFARQGISLPCFLFRQNHALMPAFGAFTGTHPVKVNERDRVYAVVENKVIALRREIDKAG